ncbi:tyrosine-protein kinase receptor Tie-1-like [Crassostrea angulata]|uniref:tyrosine-protein kinase receptor Tie-1-like n=1 Tax=Magallana angulata TaxID=2784310 RepID=UPI0022B092E7|nr:tyrosine-protein kinase receptor Tie-1-like [Crassostrea angulata]
MIVDAIISILFGLRYLFAYNDLSYNKIATQSPIYRRISEYEANNALDRNITTCMRTQAIGLSSTDNSMWWKVDLGGLYNVYRITIMFKSYEEQPELRQRGRFAGFSLYISTSNERMNSTLCYKDGPQLPPLSFTTLCIGYGRYVIFYNERMPGVSYPSDYQLRNLYTELCEVIVQGCYKHNVYGADCNVPCPRKNNTCHIHNGTCLECNPGWTGPFCSNKCVDGRYGQNCLNTCTSHCKYNNVCNHFTGQCEGGCDVGWTGSFCEKACVQSFGENCQHPCRQHCYNKECDRFNGTCLTGCTHGFHGQKCNKVFSHRAINESLTVIPTLINIDHKSTYNEFDQYMPRMLQVTI